MRLAHVRIDGNRGNENVSIDVALQDLGSVAHPRRQRRGNVDADIPLAALQRIQLSVAIANQLLGFFWQFARMRLAAIENGDLVAATQGVLHLERTGEVRLES